MSWYLAVHFSRTFGGEEIARDPCLTIRVPFESQQMAELAMSEITVVVERAPPEVVAGQVVQDVPAITAGD